MFVIQLCLDLYEEYDDISSHPIHTCGLRLQNSDNREEKEKK